MIPKYRFEVGQELIYAEEAQGFTGKSPDKPIDKVSGQWQVWVVGKNRDGSWRLLVGHKVRIFKIKPNAEPVERLSNCMLAYCDMFSDGRIMTNASLGDSYFFEINPSSLFIALPRDREAMAADWSEVPPVGEWIRHCSVDSAARTSEHTLLIKCAEHGASLAAHSGEKTRRCTFDVEAGRLTKFVEDETAQTNTFRWHNRKTVELLSTSQKPAEWIAHLHREATQFCEARTKHDALADEFRRSRTVADYKATWQRAREVLTTAQKFAKLEPIQEQYRALIKLYNQWEKPNLESAEARQDVYSRRAADWELTAIDGRKHRLSDDLGKVVVLDFWYRGCEWCEKALPQIKQVADRYKSKPVVVLGMNIDDDENDTRFVIRQMGLSYAQLKAKPAVSAYRANDLGYPVLYILDQKGRVEYIQEGYQVDLAKRVAGVVDGLLGERSR
jgi:thiol-disulfide isomerase/thioredoxin